MFLRLSLRLLIAAWLIAAIGMIVPTHAHAHMPGPPAGDHHDADEEHPHHSDDCPICHLACSISLDVPVVVAVPPHLPRCQPPVATTESLVTVRAILPFHGRAPPASA